MEINSNRLFSRWLCFERICKEDMLLEKTFGPGKQTWLNNVPVSKRFPPKGISNQQAVFFTKKSLQSFCLKKMNSSASSFSVLPLTNLDPNTFGIWSFLQGRLIALHFAKAEFLTSLTLLLDGLQNLFPSNGRRDVVFGTGWREKIHQSFCQKWSDSSASEIILIQVSLCKMRS